MRMQIGEAADHGVNVFIYDLHRFDDRTFPENCLNDGFPSDGNNDRICCQFVIDLV